MDAVQVHVAWQDVLKAEEKPDYFVVYLNRHAAGIVPKQGFYRPSEIPFLREMLSAKLGFKARLLTQ